MITSLLLQHKQLFGTQHVTITPTDHQAMANPRKGCRVSKHTKLIHKLPAKNMLLYTARRNTNMFVQVWLCSKHASISAEAPKKFRIKYICLSVT